MLVSARERLPAARFALERHRELAARRRAPDLIYANAALQWVPDHETLIPRLFAALAPGGVLADPDARQPRGAHAPPDARGGGRGALGEPSATPTSCAPQLLRHRRLLRPAGRRRRQGRRLAHRLPAPMASAAAIVEWVRGTGLKPFVDRAAAPNCRPVTWPNTSGASTRAYPARTDGKRLLAFPRMFIVAQRKRMSTTVRPSARRAARRAGRRRRAAGLRPLQRRRSAHAQEPGAAGRDGRRSSAPACSTSRSTAKTARPVGGEAEHAALVAELALAAAHRHARRRARASGGPPGLCRRHGRRSPAAPAHRLCHIMVPKVESVADVRAGRRGARRRRRRGACRCTC